MKSSVDLPALDDEVPERLPLLDALLDDYVEREHSLADVTVVMIQHQLGSVVPMTRALLRLGARSSAIHWVDIPYTSNATVMQRLLELGIPAPNFAPGGYRLDQPYAPYQRARVQAVVLRLMSELGPAERVLVLDDGAYFLEAASCFRSEMPDVRIVEQTTRGLIKLRSDAALADYCDRVVVLNVAESRPKKEIEGPLIGEVVCRALVEAIASELGQQTSTRCLLLGFGQIGEAVATSLVRFVGIAPEAIHVLDPSPAAHRRAVAAGHTPWDRATRPRIRFHLVVGCSGTTSFGIGDRIFLEDGAILASASSGSAELSREAFIELADTHELDDIYVHERDRLANRSIHDEIGIHLVDRSVRFLNGGFPVNFDGRINCVAPTLIQATHALQVGAALEALQTTDRGLTPVSDALCTWIEERFPHHADGYSPTHRDRDGTPPVA
jgi:hypothetical protein